MELPELTKQNLLKRFPKCQLNYEMISNKKVSTNYNIGIAIPMGKKCYIWFTFYKGKDVCYLIELNKEKKMVAMYEVYVNANSMYSKGTVLHGTIISKTNEGNGINAEQAEIKIADALTGAYFIIDDIFYYTGISLKTAVFSEKLKCIYDFCKKMVGMQPDTNGNCPPSQIPISFVVSALWNSPELDENITEVVIENLAYTVHHIQYRDMDNIAPYLKLSLNKKNTANDMENAVPRHLLNKCRGIICQSLTQPMQMNISKPQYKFATVFLVSADIQSDVYHLYAYNPEHKDNPFVYYNVAYIPNYAKSVYMNNIFRRIKANINLDAIEESDDEAEFCDTRPDKYVDLEKRVKMECVFNKKFRKWIPQKIVENEHVININKL